MRALVLVDLQNDFMPGGSLAVPDGDEVVPVANRVAKKFDLVVATQDWHPPDHASFAANHEGKEPGDVVEVDGLEQRLWPVHCVQGTPGARFHSDLDMDAVERVFRKGTDPRIDSYSGFYDNGHRRATGLGDFLKEQGVEDVYVVGLATNVCVRWTVLDAIRLGFRAHLVEDGCRGIDLEDGDVRKALAEMEDAGARRITSDDVE